MGRSALRPARRAPETGGTLRNLEVKLVICRFG